MSIIPDLKFPMAVYGPKETPWDLKILLYPGGAALSFRSAHNMISSGKLGEPLGERLPLVVRIHQAINVPLAEGGSRATANRAIELVRNFVTFCDLSERPLTIEATVQNYVAWTKNLRQRAQRTRRGVGIDGTALSMTSIYNYASFVGNILDKALERDVRLIESSSITKKRTRKSAMGIEAEKQNLADTFAMGHFLQDLCDGISLDNARSSERNIPITLRSGIVFYCRDRASLNPDKNLSRANFQGFRNPIVNLRVEAEMLMFIGQTGINLEQVINAMIENFFYIGFQDGYQVKEFKKRRGGPVLFEIYKEYKEHFERYLRWRKEIFPESSYLFPFISNPGVRRARLFSNDRIRRACEQIGLQYIPPRQLRNTRVNWLLRRSSDVDQTAEMSQHTRKTLLRVYHRPSLQRAIAECTRFWGKYDPHLDQTLSLAPGACTGFPRILQESPLDVPAPDCKKTAGCLWCENHRDVDSFDYVWALASFMYLKAIELSNVGKLFQESLVVPPAKLAIDRILEKITWFEESNDKRNSWVAEARERMTEKSFHPDFSAAIADIELV